MTSRPKEEDGASLLVYSAGGQSGWLGPPGYRLAFVSLVPKKQLTYVQLAVEFCADLHSACGYRF